MSYLSYPALQRLKTFLKIYPAEGRLVLLLVGMMMAATIGSSIGGASVDALFIKQFDTSRLPYIYIIMGVANFINLLLIAGVCTQRLSCKFLTKMRLYGASLKTRLLLGGFRVGSRAQKGSDNLCVHTRRVIRQYLTLTVIYWPADLHGVDPDRRAHHIDV